MIFKKISFLLFFVGLFCGINSCCTKKECIGADDINEIEFYNFIQTEIDTVTIISYKKNSNFTLFIDSLVTRVLQSGDHFLIRTNIKIQTELEYKIKINPIRQNFTLTGFETTKEGCNSCFPYRPKSDFYNQLNAYSINGQRQIGNQIKIYK